MLLWQYFRVNINAKYMAEIHICHNQYQTHAIYIHSYHHCWYIVYPVFFSKTKQTIQQSAFTLGFINALLYHSFTQKF